MAALRLVRSRRPTRCRTGRRRQARRGAFPRNVPAGSRFLPRFITHSDIAWPDCVQIARNVASTKRGSAARGRSWGGNVGSTGEGKRRTVRAARTARRGISRRGGAGASPDGGAAPSAGSASRRAASAPGWKIGKGPGSGKSFFGTDPEKPEGYIYHRFWPRTHVSGQIILKGKAIPAEGPGMHVHSVMGMRPNLVASRWNFADFQSNEHGGVSAIQMEMTTLGQFGRHGPGSGGVKVNFGSLVLGGKLVCVTAETTWPDEAQDANAPIISRAFHYNAEHDSDTGYPQPKQIEYVWSGPSILTGVTGQVSANLKVDVGAPKVPKGLIEKVDVLAEIPAVVKAVISYVAGTKPYIYQVRSLCDTLLEWL